MLAIKTLMWHDWPIKNPPTSSHEHTVTAVYALWHHQMIKTHETQPWVNVYSSQHLRIQRHTHEHALPHLMAAFPWWICWCDIFSLLCGEGYHGDALLWQYAFVCVCARVFSAFFPIWFILYVIMGLFVVYVAEKGVYCILMYLIFLRTFVWVFAFVWALAFP